MEEHSLCYFSFPPKKNDLLEKREGILSGDCSLSVDYETSSDQ